MVYLEGKKKKRPGGNTGRGVNPADQCDQAMVID
jgi:hypothetical protein